MPKYSIAITRKWMDVYIVEAPGPTQAGVELGRILAAGNAPDSQSEVSMAIGPAKVLLADVTPILAAVEDEATAD